ncbi:MAG: ABC-F family ATP-binding cassette domain-containing protein [Verrucomicrobiales bacterium]|nr:ABC-F family ATP-binding cassette domain-containing protein [Verrucomicrobiales bacterium]
MSSAPRVADPILSATQLRLSFGNQMILDDATMAIHAGDKIGLVGRNGCGKSSFLRIIAEEENADDGHISRSRGLVVGYLPQEFQLEEDATVDENIRAGAADLIDALERFEKGDDSIHERIEHADGWNLDTRIETLMRKLDTPPGERVVRHLSGGEKRRVGLARALVAQPDLLILDEPTNHLDADAIEWLEGYLAAQNGACLFVTHDRYFLDRIATRIVELSNGTFFSHDGNYSDYLIAKQERIEAEQAAEGKRQSFLRREINWVRAGVQARRTKQRSRLDNFYAVKAQKAPEKELDMDLVVPPAPPLGNVIVKLKSVSQFIENQPLFLGLDLEFEKGECVGVVGPNGAGKTTLLRVIMGDLEATEGSAKIGMKTEFNYADQTRLELDEDKSVFDEVSEGKESMRFGPDSISVRAYLKRFLFADDRINDRIGNLSGGEKNRVLLAKILKRGGNFLVLDEPTNDLDLQSLRVLEEALINFSGTSLVVSHDRYFLDRVCDRVIVFEEPGKLGVYVGNYSYYREKRRAREAVSELNKPAVSSKKRAASPGKADAPPKLKWKEERELEGIEEAILEAEESVAKLESQLNDPDFYKENAERAAEVSADLEKGREQVQQLYDRWEELESIRKTWEAWKAETG